MIYDGANTAAALAENAVKTAIEKFGEETSAAFPSTAYFCPAIYAAVGVKVQTLGDLTACLGVIRSLISGKDDLTEALNAGLATAAAAEILELIKYVESDTPYENESGIGFVPDAVIRSLGVPLVTGDIPGVAVMIGKADDAAAAAEIVRDYQEKGLLTFLIGDIIEQVLQEGVRAGLEYRVVPLGHTITGVIHVVTVAIRAALIFGAVAPGDLGALLKYTRERVPAFVNTFGALDSVTVAAGAGAIALGFPVIADMDLGDLQVPGALVSVCDHSATAAASLELRNIRIKPKAVSLPVSFASAFEGEIIRKKDTHVEFDSDHSRTCEIVVMRPANEVEDHKLTLIGPAVPDPGEDVVRMSLAVVVEVSGSKMQADFEPVIERKIHAWFNYIEGAMHTGQRNLLRIRISRASWEKGLRLEDYAEVLYSMIRSEFGSVVEKCQVTIYTDREAVENVLNELALPRYRARDDRLAALTDESVDTFYTCTMCQSFAPNHCCVVTPERLGLCGAVSWLDAKASYELVPTGPNRPIEKAELTDERLGIYETVNRMVAEATHGAVEKVSLYSLIEDPMTSCGCFECICGIEPMSGGVVVVNREYVGITPTGMTFGELASLTGGGVQTPGFMGLGRHFLASRKFIRAEGGVARIVWMPRELKADIAERLDKTAKELYNIDHFSDMICDETAATDAEGLYAFLQEKGHPVLKMEPLT